jgi:hypothetical protein
LVFPTQSAAGAQMTIVALRKLLIHRNKSSSLGQPNNSQKIQRQSIPLSWQNAPKDKPKLGIFP